MLRAGRVWQTRIQLADTQSAAHRAMAGAGDALPADWHSKATLGKKGFTVTAKLGLGP